MVIFPIYLNQHRESECGIKSALTKENENILTNLQRLNKAIHLKLVSCQ